MKSVRSCYNAATKGKFAHHRWEEDGDVLLPDEAESPDQTLGVPFEFTGPNPPELVGGSGIKKFTEALQGLTTLGVQTTPRTAIHIYLMIRDNHHWTDLQIASFWVGYVRAQYAIDELHTSAMMSLS